MKFAIIIASPPNSVYFLFDEDGETAYFETVADCENWIEDNSRNGSDYFIWDCADACILDF